MLQNALFATLGWLAGMLSAIVVDWNKHRRSAQAIMKALRTELRELSNRFAGVAYDLGIETATLDQELLSWLVVAYERYDGIYRNATMIEGLRKLEANPGQVAKDVAVMRAANPRSALGLKKYPTPALDVAVSSLGDFSPDHQTLILEIKTYIAAYDALVDDSREFMRLTFDQSLSESNHAAMRRNLVSTYTQVIGVSRKVTDLAAVLVWLK